jgi:hypothetical protein
MDPVARARVISGTLVICVILVACHFAASGILWAEALLGGG